MLVVVGEAAIFFKDINFFPTTTASYIVCIIKIYTS
ncbi:hypothetical protein T10_13632 [Trichinella papuae]|uniref:Uncharacterized protein n=1 Tax=Trichinella papuae TaxID=268474 RepID=A0A0V1LXL0_9BILA|nr:hypothetical protein T10_13632 [Trichinella papuae]